MVSVSPDVDREGTLEVLKHRHITDPEGLAPVRGHTGIDAAPAVTLDDPDQMVNLPPQQLVVNPLGIDRR